MFENKRKKDNIMIKKVLAVLLAGVICFSFAACGNKSNKNLNGENPAQESSETNVGTNDAAKDCKIDIAADDGLEVQTYFGFDDSSLIVYVMNNNDYNVGSINLTANYYDENNNQVSDDSTNLFCPAGEKTVFSLDMPCDENGNYYIPKGIKLSACIDKEMQETIENEILYNDKVKVSYTKTDEKLSVTFENTSDVTLSDIDIAVVFQKDKKPVYADFVTGQLKPGESSSQDVNIPKDLTAEKNTDKEALVDFDDVLLIVDRATTD